MIGKTRSTAFQSFGAERTTFRIVTARSSDIIGPSKLPLCTRLDLRGGRALLAAEGHRDFTLNYAALNSRVGESLMLGHSFFSWGIQHYGSM